MSTELKALHDQLLAEKPEGVVHDEASCPLCALEEVTTQIPEGGSMSDTITKEQHDAAIGLLQCAEEYRIALPRPAIRKRQQRQGSMTGRAMEQVSSRQKRIREQRCFLQCFPVMSATGGDHPKTARIQRNASLNQDWGIQQQSSDPGWRQ